MSAQATPLEMYYGGPPFALIWATQGSSNKATSAAFSRALSLLWEVALLLSWALTGSLLDFVAFTSDWDAEETGGVETSTQSEAFEGVSCRRSAACWSEEAGEKEGEGRLRSRAGKLVGRDCCLWDAVG